MDLRRASEADAAEIARVHVLAWQQTYRGNLPDEFLASLSVERRSELWARQLADAALAPGVFVVAVSERQLAGFASSGAAREQHLGFDGELYAIYLVAAYQGKGLGRRLLHASAGEPLHMGMVA
jgi:GNAT superfamily N-acetyltransferase